MSSAPQKSGALAFERQEPNLGGGHIAPSLAPARSDLDDDLDDEQDEADDEEESDDAPVVSAPRRKAAPRQPAKKPGKFELPSVNVLSAPRASDRQPLSKSELETNSRALEGVLGDFGVRGEIVKAIRFLTRTFRQLPKKSPSRLQMQEKLMNLRLELAVWSPIFFLCWVEISTSVTCTGSLSR